MVPHQGESKYADFALQKNAIDSIHSIAKVFIVIEYAVGRCFICAEMPAVMDPFLLPSDKGLVKGEVLNNLSRKFF
jgi:hypothetical protein